MLTQMELLVARGWSDLLDAELGHLEVSGDGNRSVGLGPEKLQLTGSLGD